MILCALSVLGGLNLQHLDRELPVFDIADAFQERQRRRASEVKSSWYWARWGMLLICHRDHRGHRESRLISSIKRAWLKLISNARFKTVAFK